MTILPHVYDRDWLWDTQAVLLLYLTGRRVLEQPVSWHETGDSKVSLVRDSVRMFFGLYRFRRYVRQQFAAGVLKQAAWSAGAVYTPQPNKKQLSATKSSKVS